MGHGREKLLMQDLRGFMARVPRGDLWVFGYGSLMWSPDFPHAERRPGLLHGYHRSLCIYSHRHRGTPEVPGLVMGLCPGGSCWGVAFRVPAHEVRAALTVLWSREMVNRVYEPRIVRVRAGRRAIAAVAFVADAAHRQFAGRLSVARTARLVAQGRGQRGENLEYLAQTVGHMDELGIREGHLHRVLGAVRRLAARKKRR